MRKHFFIILVIVCLAYGVAGESHSQDLLVYIPFDGTTMNRANNETGFTSGSMQYKDGACGKYGLFDGNTSIEYELQGLEEYTISFWIRIDEIPSSHWYSVVGKKADTFEGTTGKYNWTYAFYYNHWSDFQYESESNDGDHMIPIYPFKVGDWHHVACVRKLDGTYNSYLNGKLYHQDHSNNTPIANNTALILGGQTTSLAKMFKGALDELRIYGVGNDDPAFIQSLYEAPEEEATCEPIVEVVEIEIPVEKIVEKIVEIPAKQQNSISNFDLSSMTRDELKTFRREIKKAINAELKSRKEKK